MTFGLVWDNTSPVIEKVLSTIGYQNPIKVNDLIGSPIRSAANPLWPNFTVN